MESIPEPELSGTGIFVLRGVLRLFAITVRNGKVTNIREHIDTLALARASEMAA